MKFKEIKPGMVIHCPKEEDARALLEYISTIGFIWSTVDCEMENYKRYGSNTCYSIKKDSITWQIGYGHVRDYIKGGDTITEFSDLIEPDDTSTDSPINSDTDSPMSAVEVLEWLSKHCGSYDVIEVFGRDEYDGAYELSELIRDFTPQEIVEKITAYEATKENHKPVEVEEGWKIPELQKMNGGNTDETD